MRSGALHEPATVVVVGGQVVQAGGHDVGGGGDAAEGDRHQHADAFLPGRAGSVRVVDAGGDHVDEVAVVLRGLRGPLAQVGVQVGVHAAEVLGPPFGDVEAGGVDAVDEHVEVVERDVEDVLEERPPGELGPEL